MRAKSKMNLELDAFFETFINDENNSIISVEQNCYIVSSELSLEELEKQYGNKWKFQISQLNPREAFKNKEKIDIKQFSEDVLKKREEEENDEEL